MYEPISATPKEERTEPARSQAEPNEGASFDEDNLNAIPIKQRRLKKIKVL